MTCVCCADVTALASAMFPWESWLTWEETWPQWIFSTILCTFFMLIVRQWGFGSQFAVRAQMEHERKSRIYAGLNLVVTLNR